MHVDTFDRFTFANSAVHRLDPRAKLVITVLFILSNVLLPDGAWLAFCLSLGLTILVSAISQLGSAYAFKRSFVALPFALAAISTMFTLPGVEVFRFHIGPWTLAATDAGSVHFASVVLRSWISVQMAILLTATTTFPDLMHAFRHLRMPPILVAIVSFMYRYLFVLSDEVVRMLRAREARSAQAQNGRRPSLRWRAGIAGNMAGQLFLRSYSRSDRVYNAMLSRGYRGELLTLNPHIFKKRDWAAGGIATLAMLLLQVIARVV